LPRELTEEQPEDPKKKVNQMVKAQALAKRKYDYQKYQTKQAPWDSRLAQSEVGEKKFRSEILKSMWHSRGAKSEYGRKTKSGL